MALMVQDFQDLATNTGTRSTHKIPQQTKFWFQNFHGPRKSVGEIHGSNCRTATYSRTKAANKIFNENWQDLKLLLYICCLGFTTSLKA